MTVSVLAHASTDPADPWFTMATVIVLCALGALYGIGVQSLWQQRGIGSVIGIGNAVAFAVGLTVIALAGSPPVREAAGASFAGHMTQHMLLLVVAGPLLGAGGAALPISLALPHRIRRYVNWLRAHPVSRRLRRPAHRIITGCLIFTCVLWLWHLPALFAAAERHPALHALEHLSFVAVAWMLWAAVLTPDRHRLPGPVGFLLLFAVGMTGAALGAVLTFAPHPLYPPEVYAAPDALADQQLAGLVMWIPMDIVLLGFALNVFGRWLAGLNTDHPEDPHVIRRTSPQEVST